MKQQSVPRFALLNGFSQGAESRLIAYIGSGLSAEGLQVEMLSGLGRLFRLALFRSIARCDVLIVHSPLACALFYVLFARMLRRKVVSLTWDYYPVTLDGQRYDTTLRRGLLDIMESGTVSLCTHFIVPSRDFLEVERLSRAKVLPFWLPIDRTPNVAGAVRGTAIRIIFAGQVNKTRGLEHAYAELEAHFGDDFVLAIASRDQLPSGLLRKANVEHLGFLERDALRDEMARCHAGLIALSPQFDGPGLPSKTWEYLGAGLQCLFIGKDLPHYTKALISSGVGYVLSPATRATIDAKDFPRSLDEASIDQFSQHFELNAVRVAAHLRSIAGDAGRHGQS